MARPTRDPEGKRKQVAVRFGPQELSRLEELAAEATEKAGKNVSVGSLIETRIASMLSADTKTFELMVAIAEGVAEAQALAEGKPWHEDLESWGAVAEMLARGPIELMKPESIYGDTGYIGASAEQRRILQAKAIVVENLAVYGIPASILPQSELPHSGRRRGLFGASADIAARYIDRRANERKLIDAIEDEATRTKAIELHDELKALDAAADSEADFIAETKRIYTDMEDVGRARYRKHRFDALMAWIKANPVTLARPA